MNSHNELSFCELRAKELINSIDGKRLGRIIDIIFDGETGVVKGLVAPGSRKVFFNKNQDFFIPWKNVKKIGEDVIIVELGVVCDNSDTPIKESPCAVEIKKAASNPNPMNCDGKCEKCMLFDCSYRWKKLDGCKDSSGVYIDGKKY